MLPASKRLPCGRPGCRRRCAAELATLIAEDLVDGRLPKARMLKLRLKPRRRSLPEDVPVALTELASYDVLLEVRA